MPTRGSEVWIETDAGGAFFVQAILIAPVALVLVPLVGGGALRWLGVLRGPSPVFDTIPAVAWYFLPRVGWLAALAALTTLRAIRIVERPWPRRALLAFFGLHVATFGLCVARWLKAVG